MRAPFYYKMVTVQGGTFSWLKLLYPYKDQGTRLIKLLREEYHLEKE